MSQKIKQIPAYEQIFEIMKENIRTDKWKINEKIPSEMELSELFGVNRLTVRMALQRLNSMGLLETKTGDGTYVKEFSFRDYIDKITDFYVNPGLIDKVAVFRRAIEIESAKLAIQYATPEEIERLEEICKEYQLCKDNLTKKQTEESFQALIDKDMEFHYHICLMSHNELFVYAFDVARESIYQHISILLNDRIEHWVKKGLEAPEWKDLHFEICHAIKHKDYKACKEAYLNMVDFQVDLSNLS